MRAILIDPDKRLTWSEVPDPIAKADEVLIEIHAAALNRADLLQRDGLYPPPPGWPEWMGLEVAGVVLQAPSDSRWKIGDKVCALLGGGGYAERVAVPAGMVLPVEEHTALLREYLAAAEQLQRPKRDNARVVINGSFCEQPPLSLPASLEDPFVLP